ncbi:MAG: DUF4145 domain-containing protein [Acetobacteraceae bacterium]
MKTPPNLTSGELRIQLEVDNCPHCGTAKPTLALPMIHGQGGQGIVHSQDYTGKIHFMWLTYICSTCGKGVLAGTKLMPDNTQERVGLFPAPRTISEDVPDAARNYLSQAIRSLSTPDGAVMLAASSVDAMLKAKKLVSGSLNTRINEAKDTHLITPDMADWAHDVRLDANDSRHADLNQPHHTPQSAERAVEFTVALAEALFVLPARVQRGRNVAKCKAK